MLVKSRADLEILVQARAHGSHSVGALLALEGSQALEGDLAAIDTLYAAGFRMMAPTHFVDTEISGSAHGTGKGGLTPIGREWLGKLEEKRILVDLAHASPQAVDEVLALAKRPLVVSHTGVKGTCDSPRNLSDAQLHKLARNGALVGSARAPRGEIALHVRLDLRPEVAARRAARLPQSDRLRKPTQLIHARATEQPAGARPTNFFLSLEPMLFRA